jgi:hypothetical protein
MTRTAKILAVVVGAVLVLVLGTGLLVAGTAVSSGLAGGLMTVSVHEDGPDGVDLFIPVPAALVEVVIAVAPVAIRLADHHHDLDADLERAREELEVVLPALETLLDGLAEMPDAVLVEVEGAGEYVRVSKEGSSLVVLVEESGSRVAVRVPARVFRAVRGLVAG